VRYYEPQWNGWELFDLVEDPHELHDLSNDPAHADVRAALQTRLDELRRQYGDTTGDLGDGDFDVTAGIARVQRAGGGLRVWANASGGYLLKTGDPGGTRFTTTMTSVAGRQLRNGFVLLAGGDPRRDLVRAGIEFGAHKLAVVGPGGLRARADAAIDWDGKSPIDVTVRVDLKAHTLVAEALGKRVEVELPADWAALTAAGYGASNAETVFTELRIE